MQVVIYIGLFKTGSTSLQRFLAQNYLRLRQAGILYPAVEARGLARQERAARRGCDLPLDGAGLNETEPHNALALRMRAEAGGGAVPPYYPDLPPSGQMLATLRQQMVQHDPGAVVLCSEVFSLLGLLPGQRGLRQLAALLAGQEVTIYFTLRRLDDYLSSWHRQRLKFGDRLSPLAGSAYGAYQPTAHFQHGAALEAWMRHFPRARLVLRDFDLARRRGGTVADFAAHSGLALPEGLQPVAPCNPSVPAALWEVARAGIHALGRDEGGRLARWLAGHAGGLDLPPDGDVEMFGPRCRPVMPCDYAPVLAQLRALSGNERLLERVDLSLQRPVRDWAAAARALPDLRTALSGAPEMAAISRWIEGWQVTRGQRTGGETSEKP
ncbi:MAG: hypothetical protein CR993_08130 [Rhodobacterales bacterium]|nr:MAG: hypothetical protein CR993_08130 [Rhodobacterales bacterium]